MFLFLCMYNYMCRYYCFRTYMCAHVFRWYHLTLCDHMLSGKHVSSFRDTDIQPLGQSFRQRTRALLDHECTKENYPTARPSKASFSSFPPRFQIVLQQASAVRSLYLIYRAKTILPCLARGRVTHLRAARSSTAMLCHFFTEASPSAAFSFCFRLFSAERISFCTSAAAFM